MTKSEPMCARTHLFLVSIYVKQEMTSSVLSLSQAEIPITLIYSSFIYMYSNCCNNEFYFSDETLDILSTLE